VDMEKTTSDNTVVDIAKMLFAASSNEKSKLKIRISQSGDIELELEGSASDILETAIECMQIAMKH
jgi:hypothetical protein